MTGRGWDPSAKILQSPLPSLHSISLSGVTARWTLILLPETLTSPQVSTHLFNGDSCADVLDVLKRVPNLEDLHLDPLPHQAGKLFGTANLPHLKWFTLTVNLNNAVDFLNCPSVPSSTRFCRTIPTVDWCQLSEFMPSLLKYFERMPRALERGFTTIDLRFYCPSNRVALGGCRELCTHDFSLTLCGRDYTNVLEAIVGPVLRVKNLQILRISDLAAVASLYPLSETGEIPVPVLSELTVVLTEEEELLEELYTCFGQRWVGGFKFPMLRLGTIISQSKKLFSSIERLREVVDGVEVI